MPGMLVWRRSSTLRAMPTGVSTVARPSDSCRLVDGLLLGWANRMSVDAIRRAGRCRSTNDIYAYVVGKGLRIATREERQEVCSTFEHVSAIRRGCSTDWAAMGHRPGSR